MMNISKNFMSNNPWKEVFKLAKTKQTMKGVTCKNGYWYARIDSDLKYPLSHLLGMVLGMDFFDKK